MSDIYKIGVAIMMTQNGLAPALSQLSHKLLGLHVSIAKINSGIGGWKTGLIGAAGIMGGVGILGAAAKIASYGDKFLDQQAKLKILGLDNKQIAEATAKAWENTRAARGSHVDENLKAIGEMYSITGFDEALKMSTKLAQVNSVLQNVTGKEGEAFTIARGGELMGKFVDQATKKFDAAGFDKFLDLIVRSAIATHGKVTPDQWLAFAKQGNVAAGGLTEEGLMAQASTIQAMGGFRTGTAGQAMIRQMVGGVMAQRVAKELVRVGLLDPSKLHIEKGGHVVIDQGGLVGGDVLQKDQLAFFHDIVLPAWEKHGIMTPESQMKEYYQMFGTGPAQRLAFELIRGYPQIMAERERMKGASGVGGSLNTLYGESPIAARGGAHAAYENMMTAWGSEGLRAAIPLMNELTNVLNAVGAFAIAHPTAMKILGEGFVGLGVALTAAGGAALIAALGPTGWFVLGIGALGTAIGVLALNYDKIFNHAATAISTGPLGTNDTPGGAALDRPLGSYGRRKSAEPPPPNSDNGKVGAVYMDGQKVGAIVTDHQVAAASNPTSLSAYYDPTMPSHMPVDFAFARG